MTSACGFYWLSHLRIEVLSEIQKPFQIHMIVGESEFEKYDQGVVLLNSQQI